MLKLSQIRSGSSNMPKKKIPEAAVKTNVFFETFVGEMVQIFCKTKMKQILQDDHQTQEQESPVMFEGWLLDVDDYYYYLGDTPDEVCSAIDKTEFGSIHIVKEANLYDDILDSMDEPESKDVN